MRKIFAIGLVFITTLTLNSCSKPATPPNEQGGNSNAPIKLDGVYPCLVTGTPLIFEDCQAAELWLRQAREGTAAFNIPPSMVQGQTKIITLAVSAKVPPSIAAPELESLNSSASPSATGETIHKGRSEGIELRSVKSVSPSSNSLQTSSISYHQNPHDVAMDAASGKDKIIDYYPLVGRQMSAELSGIGFEIEAKSPRVQIVADGAVTTWEWRVKAVDFGDDQLIMKTEAVMIDSQGKVHTLKPSSERKFVKVWVGPDGVFKFFKELPEWLQAITAILGAMTALVVGWKTFIAISRRGKAAD